MKQISDTIYALATPQGRSAVQIIRISGALSSHVLTQIAGGIPKLRQAKYAKICLQGNIAPIDQILIDRALVLFFQAPASATGEDIAELHLHGSPILGRMVMDWLGQQPALRLADRGEFTRRGFMNGKVNLDQAEGIADIIDADTAVQHQQAMRQLDGALSQKTESWRQIIIKVLAQLEALIDFADEELPDDVTAQLSAGITDLLDEMSASIRLSNQGLIQRDGINIAILGKPNAGKSTLLNVLIGDDRAIVSPQAGTTRDLVRASLDINGLAVHVTDTAGIRDNAEQDVGIVEEEGVRRAINAAAKAEIVLMLIDHHEDDIMSVYESLMGQLRLTNNNSDDNKVGQIVIPVLTKSDLMSLNTGFDPDWLQISANTGAGMDALDRRLKHELANLAPQDEAPILTRQRHISAVQTAADALRRSQSIDLHLAPELMAEELRLSAESLGRITGRIDVEDVLDHIFSSFCIGK